jgi:hypothetical protein
MRIYLTYCSAKKDDSLKCTGKKVTPDILYTSDRIRCFMNKCKEKQVKWAIFSDKHDVWFSNEKHEWYDKPPDEVTDSEFKGLLKNFDKKLRDYKEIFFYYHPRSFHRLYRRLLKKTKLKKKVKWFTHVREITKRDC